MEFVQPQVPDLSQITQQMMQIKDHKKRQDLMDMQMQQANMQLADARREQMKKSHIQELFSNSYDKESGKLNSDSFANKLADAGYVDEYNRFVQQRTEMMTAAKQLRAAELEAAKDSADLTSKLASQVYNTTLAAAEQFPDNPFMVEQAFQEAHAQAFQMAKQNGIASYPEEIGSAGYEAAMPGLRGLITSNSEAWRILEATKPKEKEINVKTEVISGETPDGRNFTATLLQTGDASDVAKLPGGPEVPGATIVAFDWTDSQKTVATSAAETKANVESMIKAYEKGAEQIEKNYGNIGDKLTNLTQMEAAANNLDAGKFNNVVSWAGEWLGSLPGGERLWKAMVERGISDGAQFNRAFSEFAFDSVTEMSGNTSDKDALFAKDTIAKSTDPKESVKLWINIQKSKSRTGAELREMYNSVLGGEVKDKVAAVQLQKKVADLKQVYAFTDPNDKNRTTQFRYFWDYRNHPNNQKRPLTEVIDMWNQHYGK